MGHVMSNSAHVQRRHHRVSLLSLFRSIFGGHAVHTYSRTTKKNTTNVKLGLIIPAVLNNLLLPQKKMQFKNRWSPSINKNPRLKNLQCWNPFFIQQCLFPILFISIYFLHFLLSSLLYLRFELIIENFKKQLFPKWSISNENLYKNHQFG